MDNPDIDMKSNDDSIHHCRSPTPTLNGCDLTPLTRIQSSEQEYSYLTTRKRHPSTPHSHNPSPKAFHEETGRTFPRGRQNMCIRLWRAPRISRKFAGECRFICSVMLLPRRKPHWYHPALVQLFSRHLGIHSSWEAKQRDVAIVGSFTPVSLFVYGDDQFANLLVPLQNPMTLGTHESAKPSGVLYSPNSLSNFSQSALSSDLAAASESLLMYSTTEAFICAKSKHPS